MRPRLPLKPVAEQAALRLQQAWLRRGPLACLLWPVSQALGVLVALRRSLHRHGIPAVETLPVPVVVVGNLVAGGAGKTPTVLAVVERLRALGHRPGIVSRGHGRRGSAPRPVHPDTPVELAGDEALLLRLRSRAPVWVGRDRVATVRALLTAEPQTTVVVSDDGLQHLRLTRQVQLVVFDERGAGNGWLLPAGPLREPLPAGTRWPGDVPTRVLYNAAEPSTALSGSLLHSRLPGAVALADWWQGLPAQAKVLQALASARVLAAAGTARPQRFFSMLRQAGLRIDELPLPDHHPYQTLPWPADTTDVVVTEKDAVKLLPDRLGTTRAWVVPLDLQLDPGTARWLADQLPAPPTRP